MTFKFHSLNVLTTKYSSWNVLKEKFLIRNVVITPTHKDEMIVTYDDE